MRINPHGKEKVKSISNQDEKYNFALFHQRDVLEIMHVNDICRQ